MLRARFNFNSRSPSGSKLALCPAVALRSLPNFCPLATYQGVRPNPLGLFVLDVPTYQGLKSCLFLGNKSLVARVNRSWMNIYRTATRPTITSVDSSNGLSGYEYAIFSWREVKYGGWLVREMKSFAPLFFSSSSSEDTLCAHAEGHSRSRSTPRRAYTYSWCH